MKITANYSDDLPLWELEESDLRYSKDNMSGAQYCSIKGDIRNQIFLVKGKIYVYKGESKHHINYISDDLFEHIISYDGISYKPDFDKYEGIKEYVNYKYDHWKLECDFRSFFIDNSDILRSGKIMGDYKCTHEGTNDFKDLYHIKYYLDTQELETIRKKQKSQLPIWIDKRFEGMKEDFLDRYLNSDAKEHLLIKSIEVLKNIFDKPLEQFNDVAKKGELFIDVYIPHIGKLTYNGILEHRKRFVKYSDLRRIKFDALKYYDKNKKYNPLDYYRKFLDSLYVHPLIGIKSLHKFYKFLIDIEENGYTDQTEIFKELSFITNFKADWIQNLKSKISINANWYGKKNELLLFYDFLIGLKKPYKEHIELISTSFKNEEEEAIYISNQNITDYFNKYKDSPSKNGIKIRSILKKI